MSAVKCAICGAQSTPKGLAVHNINSPSSENETGDQWWSANCAQVLGNVLFGSPTHLLVQYFKSAKYCSTCSQVIKDFQHFAKQLEYFQNHLDLLAKDIRNRINLQYVHNSQENLNYDLGLERLVSLSEANDINILNNYDRKEIEEMIYAAVCRRIQTDLEATHVTGDNSFVTLHQSEKDPVNEIEIGYNKVTHKANNNVPPDPNDSISMVETFFDEMDFQSSCDVGNDDDDYDEQSTSQGDDDTHSDEIIVEIPAQCRRKEILDAPAEVGNKSGGRKKRLNTIWYQTSKKNIEKKEENRKLIDGNRKYICKFCKKAFSIVYNLHKHIDMEHSDSKGYSCLFCEDRTFATLDILKSHFDRCHSKCKVCPLVFKTKMEHDSHFVQKHEKNACGICMKVFKFKKDVDKHIEEAHSKEKGIYCSSCRQGFPNNESYNDHVRLHDESDIRCKKCKKGFLSQFDLADHEKIHKTERLTVFSNLYSCSICHKVCVNAEILDKHLKNHSVDKKSHECNICAELCFSKANLNSHLTEVHKNGDKFICSKCSKEFKLSGDLKKHLYTHEKDRPFQCRVCQRFYNNRKYLKRHELHVHNKNRERLASLKFKRVWSRYSHFCQFCGRGYKHEEELNEHITQAHSGPNPFLCGFCTEIFSNSVDLKNHTTKHHPTTEDVKKFKCTYCDKSFVVGKYLEDHMKLHGDPALLVKCTQCPKRFINELAMKTHLTIHNTTILFKCSVCKKGFTYRKAYDTHMRNNHAQKNVKCNICDKMFANLQRLRNHEATHTALKLFRCEHCNKGFNTEGNLRSHVNIIHLGQPTAALKRKRSGNI